MYVIRFTAESIDNLQQLRATDRALLLDTIKEQLSHEPQKETRNRKPLVGLKVPWEQEGPGWELRVGELRVFYDVQQREDDTVVIRAIRRKPPHKKTEDVL